MNRVAQSVPKSLPSAELAIIGGSDAHLVLPRIGSRSHWSGALSTPFGLSSPLHLIHTEEFTFLFLARHGDEGYTLAAPFVNYRANIFAMKECGVERIVAWSGPGAIDPNLAPGELVVPDDLIDETRRRPSSFYEGTGLGFIRQSPVFCPELRSALLSAGSDCLDGCVYVCTEGPRLETPAEIRKYAQYGGQMVGMTLAPECFLARELEICYAPICYISNYAEGVRQRENRPGELFEGLLDAGENARVTNAVQEVAKCALAALHIIKDAPRECTCARAMERYRLSGRVGDDWHTWICDSEFRIPDSGLGGSEIS